MSKPVLFGLDGSPLRRGRFLQERSWCFWDDDVIGDGLSVLATSSGTVTIPQVGTSDTEPSRAVLTTAATNGDLIRLAAPEFVSHRYAVAELEVSRLKLNSTTAATLQVGFSAGPNYTQGLYVERAFDGGSVATTGPWVLHERTSPVGNSVNTETRLQTAQQSGVMLRLMWFIQQQWFFLMDGDAVLHSQAVPVPAGGTLRPMIKLLTNTASAATAAVSAMTVRLWHDI